jgi:CheY-like chemotaxis protein
MGLKGPGATADDLRMPHPNRARRDRGLEPIEQAKAAEVVAFPNLELLQRPNEAGAPRSTMGPEIESLVANISAEKFPATSGIERRRRTRAKIDFRVLVKGGIGTLEAFEDVVHSVDVTRDGLLLSTLRSGYWVGEALQVTFPYWNTPTAINKPRRATVIRNGLMRNLHYGLAVQFEEGVCNDGEVPWIAVPFPSQVRVLGVESDPRMVRAMRELLEHDGYQVVFVSTAQEALDILRYETPDVLLAEAEGGGISGQDLCAIVKSNDRLQHVPVILMTNSALPSDYSACHELGAVVCMMKPCQPGRLQRAVHLVAAPPAERTVYSARFNMAPFVRTT